MQFLQSILTWDVADANKKNLKVFPGSLLVSIDPFGEPGNFNRLASVPEQPVGHQTSVPVTPIANDLQDGP